MSDSLVSVGAFAFYECTNLSVVNVNNFAMWCNVIFTIRKNQIASGKESANPLYYGTLCQNNKPLNSVVIPDTVTQINEYVFYSQNLSSITIPESVINISENAFYNCTVENATIPLRHLDAIDKEKLQTLTLTSGTKIKDLEFSHCDNLTRVTLPEGITSIGERAFWSCDNLQSINIPNSVTSIGAFAFSSCRKLESINIPNGVTTIGDGTFIGCNALTTVEIPNSVTSIGELAFSSRGLTEVTIPASVKRIGSMAFSECYNLKKVNYLGTIDEWVQIQFDNGSSSFYYSNPNKIPYSNPLCYAQELYINDQLVTEANITTATKINDYVFYNYRVLTKLTIPSGVTSIGNQAFYYCVGIKTVMVGSNVTNIADGAFGMCEIENVYYGGTEEQCNKITAGSDNSSIVDAPRYYYSATQPITDGNYWYYAPDGTIQIWTKED